MIRKSSDDIKKLKVKKTKSHWMMGKPSDDQNQKIIMIRLSKIPTTPPKGTDKGDIKKATKKMVDEIAELQYKMYAEGKKSILIVLQGMDASGKDGVTKNIFKECSPSGVSVTSFKKPTDEEFAHDFLWRVHKHAPAKGQIKIFNRSHYEDILIQKVHGWITPKQQKMRMDAINAFEQLLQFDNNTTILKFYMHLSPARQLEKLQERIDDPEKNWKHNDGDWKERELWAKYRRCYEYAINNSVIPWHIIPVDSRPYRDYCAAKIILATLKKMRFKLPVLPPKS